MPSLKRLIAGIIYLLLSLTSFPQDTTGVIGETNPSIVKTKWLYKEFHGGNCKLNFASANATGEPLLFIIGDTSCEGKNRSYIIVKDTSIYYMYVSDFVNAEDIDGALAKVKATFPEFEMRKRIAIRNSPNFLRVAKQDLEEKKVVEEALKQKKIERETDSLLKLIDKSLVTYREKNWVLWDWSWGYGSQYSKFVDVDITIINPYKKKIKYLWFTFSAFNPVGDPVKDGTSRKLEKIVQGIGPIEYGGKGTYNFESVFYSNVIETMKMKQIKIQFFDGTFKTILNPVNLNMEY